MQAFKKLILISGFVFAFGGFGLLTAQSMPEMPDFPEITPPTLGGSFYKPTIPYYPKNNVKKQNKDTTTESEGTAKSSATLSDGSSTQALLNSLLGSSDFLTASDITSLADSGSFNTLSSLYGVSSLTNSTESASTNILLRQILTELEELKKENKELKTASGNENFKTRNAQILRFKINGYDIKDSLTTVYFSQMENDGSFLLTADRRYVADQKLKNETFYFLFKAKDRTGNIITYEVSPSIMQDEKNENSFVYKLANTKNLTAQKTGNLVVMHSDTKDCESDMLLDLDL